MQKCVVGSECGRDGPFWRMLYFFFRKGLLFWKHICGRNTLRKHVQCLLGGFVMPVFQQRTQYRTWSWSAAKGSVANAKGRRWTYVRPAGLWTVLHKELQQVRGNLFQNLSQQARLKPATCFRTLYCWKWKLYRVTCAGITGGSEDEAVELQCLASQQSFRWGIRPISALNG